MLDIRSASHSLEGRKEVGPSYHYHVFGKNDYRRENGTYIKPNVFLRSAGWSNADGSPLSYSIINGRTTYKSVVNVRRQISIPIRHVAIASGYAQ